MDEKTQDKFSDLHIDLKHLILQHLPIEEIARTSVLCSPWRHVIFSHPTLNFDQRSYNHWLKNQCYTPFKSPVDEFLKSVLHILSNQTGPLDRFTLYVPYEEEWKNSHSLVQQIVTRVPKTVTHLCVCNDAHDMWPLDVPNLEELTHLELDRCSIESNLPLTFFPNLTQLDLGRVNIPCDLGQTLSRIAPRLELLRLWSCYGSDSRATTIGVPSLTELFMDKCRGNVFLSSETSKLSSVTLSLGRQSRFDRQLYSVIGFRHYLHKLTRLEILDSYTLKVLCHSLKKIKLADDNRWALQKLIIHGNDLSESACSEIGLVELLERAKNVRELCIKDTARPGRFPADDDYSVCRLKDVTLDRLRTLSFTIGCGPRVDLLSLRCLLACSPALEKLNVGFSDRLGPSERQNVEKRISEFQRASSTVKVTYFQDITTL